MTYIIEDNPELLWADSVVDIINRIHQRGLSGKQFEVLSDCPQKGLYVKFDGKYRRVENA